MKKILSILCALPLITVSCEEKPQESSLIVAEQIYLNEADIALSGDFSKITAFDSSGEKVLIFGQNKSGGYMGYITDRDFVDYVQFTFKLKKGEEIKSTCMGKYGRTAVLTNEMLYIIASDSTVFKKIELNEIEMPFGVQIMANGEDFLINTGECLINITLDGEQTEIDTEGNSVLGLVKNSEDMPMVLLGYGEKTELVQISGTELTERQECGNLMSGVYAVCSGNEKYTLFANFGDGLYGLCDGEWQKITDFMDNSFSATSLWGMTNFGDEFAVVVSTPNGEKLKMLSEQDISEIKTKKVITIAGRGDADIEFGDKIRAFNSASDEYRIELRNYNSTDYIENTEMLREDILSGNPPDILQNNLGNLTAENLGESMFVDFYTLIDNDEKISRDDFIDGYLEAMDYNGKLIQISSTIGLKTMLVKDKYKNGFSEWNAEQMFEIIANRPENMGVYPWDYQDTKTWFMLNIIDCMQFVDFEKAECYYNSPEFVNIMKLIYNSGFGMTEAEEDSWLTENEGYDDHYQLQYRFFYDDMYLINIKGGGYQQVDGFMHGLKSDSTEVTGFPNDMGNGTTFVSADASTFSIMASSNCIDGAWEFIRDSFFSEDFYNNPYHYGIPVIEEYLDKEIVEAVAVPEEECYVRLDMFSDERTYYEPLTDEEGEKFKAIVSEAVKHNCRKDYTVQEILHEELMPYFEGERTAQESADIIQNRVSIYLSEQYK